MSRCSLCGAPNHDDGDCTALPSHDQAAQHFTTLERNGRTHPQCPVCGTIWRQTGNQTGHCSGCHRTFSSLKAFDRHRHGEGRERHCITVEQEEAFTALVQDGQTYYSITPTEADLERLERMREQQP